MINCKLITKYINYLITVKNYSTKSIESYEKVLIEFFYFIKDYCSIEKEVSDFTEITLMQIKDSDIIAYLVYENYSKNNIASTLKFKLSIIRNFFAWICITSQDFRINPAKDIEPLEQIRLKPKYLSLQESIKITNIFNLHNSKNPIRDNAIISVFLNCGLRVSELININISNIDFKEKKFSILGKGNKERTLYFNTNVESHILEYIRYRKNIELYFQYKGPLFVNFYGKALSVNVVEEICKNAYRLAGLQEKKYSTHII